MSRHFKKSRSPVSRFGAVIWLLLVLAMAGAPTRAFSQGTIRYELEDKVDGGSGDLWEYRFYLSGFNFQADEGLSIFFDYQLYRNLVNTTSGSLDPKWDLLVVQPDLLLTDDGFLDAQAQSAAPSLVLPFVVNFIWLGGEELQPGDLPYYTYDPDFQLVSGGLTSTVPEPGVLTLLGLGLVVLGWRWQTQKR